ncbi:uncharacterized protein LOC123198933 [Mangifera indica]|uniref:uncharacterized protein LOC123198933 n=1 Tax=Mangifera indica TaxID=29780 RepID=UPI001CFACD53|nr:uncharacterized protein LOC123198933 [Mangifera indica]
MTKAMRLSISGAIKLWKGYEARVMILLSLCLQIILIIFGSRRKYLKNYWINLLVWLAYLAADLVATTALGLIASGVESDHKSLIEIQAFWAPFLLLHLGGPDSITAYSLEDNELWLRHLLGLVFQVGVAFYVFFSCWRNNVLTFITIPMFITGIIKYGERTFVLRSSGTKQLKDSLRPAPDPGPNYAKIVGDVLGFGIISEMDLKSTAIVPQSPQMPKENDLVEANFLFKRFKYLFAGLILSTHEKKDTRSIIHKKSAKEAFKLLEIELGFMYDVLYTKAFIIYTRLGMILRCIYLFSHVCILVFFQTMIHKSVYPPIDISITYALIFGAIVLEAYAFITLVFSDWTQLWMINGNYISNDACFYGLRWCNGKRWSRSMGQYNLISFCLKDISTKCSDLQKSLGIKEELEKYCNLTWKDVNDDLQELIFEQLHKITKEIIEWSFNVGHYKKILAQRGNNCPEQLHWSTIETDFDRSLLLWHIATDLCYHVDLDHEHEDVKKLPPTCKISKCLSDYMLYLLVVCPTMLPKGIGEIRYKDTCAEAMRFFIQMKFAKSTNKKLACQELLNISTDNDIDMIKGGKSQSVLFHGCKLAKELQKLESVENGSKEEKWKTISEVWMEILEYAASRCEWKEHGRHLMQGGEFLTHLCLLMAHLGLSEQYQIEAEEIPLPT